MPRQAREVRFRALRSMGEKSPGPCAALRFVRPSPTLTCGRALARPGRRGPGGGARIAVWASLWIGLLRGRGWRQGQVPAPPATRGAGFLSCMARIPREAAKPAPDVLRRRRQKLGLRPEFHCEVSAIPPHGGPGRRVSQARLGYLLVVNLSVGRSIPCPAIRTFRARRRRRAAYIRLSGRTRPTMHRHRHRHRRCQG